MEISQICSVNVGYPQKRRENWAFLGLVAQWPLIAFLPASEKVISRILKEKRSKWFFHGFCVICTKYLLLWWFPKTVTITANSWCSLQNINSMPHLPLTCTVHVTGPRSHFDSIIWQGWAMPVTATNPRHINNSQGTEVITVTELQKQWCVVVDLGYLLCNICMAIDNSRNVSSIDLNLHPPCVCELVCAWRMCRTLAVCVRVCTWHAWRLGLDFR